MSSLETKANKSRSAAPQKSATKKATKAASKKSLRSAKITKAPKSKKSAASKARKASTARKPSTSTTRKVTGATRGKAPAKKSAAKSRPAAKSPARRIAAKASAPSKTAARKASQAPPPKKMPSVNDQAVKSFEQALKLFNRHEFAAARQAFEALLEKYVDKEDIRARARTYLLICEQRLARTPAPPRDPNALYDRGVFELNRGNPREAVGLFEKALKIDPRADHIHYSLAAAHARLNEQASALDALRRAISLRPLHRPHARRDHDFASLHDNPDFRQLTGFGFDSEEE